MKLESLEILFFMKMEKKSDFLSATLLGGERFLEQKNFLLIFLEIHKR